MKINENEFVWVEKYRPQTIDDIILPEAYKDIFRGYITNNEIDIMNTFFNRRHLLEHTDGIVDQKYLDKTNDNSYVIGQRIIIKENDVLIILDIVRKLCVRLQK